MVGHLSSQTNYVNIPGTSGRLGSRRFNSQCSSIVINEAVVGFLLLHFLNASPQVNTLQAQYDRCTEPSSDQETRHLAT